LPSTFVAQAGTVGNYGTFAIGTDGAWTYAASSAHNEFAGGTTYNDTFSVASADGTLTSVTINIVGTDDAPVVGSRFITQTFSGTVIMDALHEIAMPFGTTGATSLNIPAPTDVDSTMLIATVTSLPIEGNVHLGAAFGAAAVEIGETLSVAQLTSLTYTPPGYIGNGSQSPFSYSISDGSLATSAATSASVLIQPYNGGATGTEGNDIIVCSTTTPINTSVSGQTGADHFVFNQVPGWGNSIPTIYDFTHGADVLDFSGAGFGLMVDSAANVVTASSPGAAVNLPAGSFILDNHDTAGGFLYFDANGGSGSDAIPIVLLLVPGI
jgi:VCBS repeat-containing protein